MINFHSFSGVVTGIHDFLITPDDQTGCYQLLSVQDGANSIVNFVVSPSTYIVERDRISVGDWITGYYDANAPVPLIYPPQYRALVIVRESPVRNVKVDAFDSHLVSQDKSLKLHLAPCTKRSLTNGLAFTKSPANRDLVVIYGPSTKSIPAQTTPFEVIVLCL
ncbi:hypothetical protein B0H94_105206 [Salsuginibacillus halophilus]|uniref:Uncharacterized protein n=1 Tax=Salsuginibacillus halophilus TaxID=517424 RepID=A0A2P8HLI5_9BACI|nr:hypothetical protein [Salsuginibacillus halophilus]PSL47050.1 hypothetical protein B0H94_105206 [Salsuginibacillus halophilus]